MHAQKLFKPILSSFGTNVCNLHTHRIAQLCYDTPRTCDGQKFKWICCDIDMHYIDTHKPRFPHCARVIIIILFKRINLFILTHTHTDKLHK